MYMCELYELSEISDGGNSENHTLVEIQKKLNT